MVLLQVPSITLAQATGSLGLLSCITESKVHVRGIVTCSPVMKSDLPGAGESGDSFSKRLCFLSTELCNHPVMKGTCHLSLYRFYYNKITSLCEPFVFSGCGGNRNNFKSKHVCEYYCIHKQVSSLGPRPIVNDAGWLGSQFYRQHLKRS